MSFQVVEFTGEKITLKSALTLLELSVKFKFIRSDQRTKGNQMRKGERVAYEWCIETLDPDTEGVDILDHNHQTKLSDYKLEQLLAVDLVNFDLCLIRDMGDDDNGLQDRQWCYAEFVDGILTLPEYFSDSGGTDQAKVPQYYRAEFMAIVGLLQVGKGKPK